MQLPKHPNNGNATLVVSEHVYLCNLPTPARADHNLALYAVSGYTQLVCELSSKLLTTAAQAGRRQLACEGHTSWTAAAEPTHSSPSPGPCPH
jgi:hypothetical protein